MSSAVRRAPNLPILLSTGVQIQLSDLYAEHPITLVFLRHFGCSFCREQVAALRLSPILGLVFVGMGEPDQTESFRKRMASEHPYICDPDRVLYQAFGLTRGRLSDVLGPKMFVRGFGATLRGHWVGVPIGDIWQMPGIFRIEVDGTISWEYRAADASAVLRPTEIPS